MTDTVPGLVRRAAVDYGDAVACAMDGRTISYAELHDLVRRTAAAFQKRGMRGGRVVLWAPNSIDWIVAALAVTYAGGTLVPANSRYTAHEVADIVDRTGAALVIVADGFLGRTQIDDLRALTPAAPILDLADIGILAAIVDELDLATVEALADAVTPDDIADILFTSGTSGRPKGVLSAHRQTVAAAAAWSAVGEVSSADRYLVISPFFHSYGYKVGVLVGLLHGCTLHPMATFDADAALALIESERITMVPGAPAIFLGLLESPAFASTDTSSLRFANTGAANVPVALVERLQRELSFDLVITAFGMTECVVATMCRRGDSDETVATTCGRAIDGMETAIADPETGEHLPAGQRGRAVAAWFAGHARLPRRPGRHRRGDRRRRAGCTPATSGCSTTTATCASPTGSRTCTSAAGSTSIRPRSSRRSYASTASSTWRSSALPTSVWARSARRSSYVVRVGPTPTQ